ncbi:class I SAM-dependent methyltransferase [Streptomyces goshikiensis]|uniref:class I SAM-dependent methyltransferase n=1 Tax=Streptomyces goshikiensis TaxID=1942 RepID=UPI0036C216E7
MTSFASAAPYYARFRPPYPDALFTLLRDRFFLDGTQHVLDLGCGPGTIAIPLAPFAAVVHAVDSEPAMLAEGIRLAAASRTTNVAWQVADATELPTLGLPPLSMATLGKSFHRMDRRRLLADLDRLILPQGGVVFVSTASASDPPPWLPVIEDVAASHLGADYRSPQGVSVRRAGTLRDQLGASAFGSVYTVLLDQPVQFTLEELIGFQLSLSYTSPAVLGARQDPFTADLRTALAGFDTSGVFQDARQVECMIAVRRASLSA